MTTTISPGDTVYFSPKHQSLKYFMGRRTVKRIEEGRYILSCGDIRLEAARDEITLVQKAGLK